MSKKMIHVYELRAYPFSGAYQAGIAPVNPHGCSIRTPPISALTALEFEAFIVHEAEFNCFTRKLNMHFLVRKAVIAVKKL